MREKAFPSGPVGLSDKTKSLVVEPQSPCHRLAEPFPKTFGALRLTLAGLPARSGDLIAKAFFSVGKAERVSSKVPSALEQGSGEAYRALPR
jgi:hypothetical protein